MFKPDRRQFLGLVASAAAAAGQSGAICRVADSAGRPLPAEDLERFHICDLTERTIPLAAETAGNEIRFQAPQRPFRIAVPLAVPGFGKVIAYADNRGRGYTPESFTAPLDLNAEFAQDRLTTARRLADECRRESVTVAAATERRIEKAAALASGRQWSESFCESLWASEDLVVGRARHRIERAAPRPGFLFGCNAFGYPANPDAFARTFEDVFNFATLPFYLKEVEKSYGAPDYKRVDRILEWLGQSRGVLMKGHPLVWMNPKQTPEWLKGKGFEEAKGLVVEAARRSVLRYRRQIHAWDVINEAHLQNALGFTAAQQVELTRAACEAARAADPTCFRVVNSCCTWSEYMRKPKTGQCCVYDYLDAVVAAGIPFEAVGLQYYYSGRDLVEFERSLESFRGFGKPIHITELGLPSAFDTTQPPWDPGVWYVWHGEQWTEQLQADWVEQFYTLAYSKPYIEAITWWNLTDPAFVPNGGLARADLTVKESYRRLAALIARWRGQSERRPGGEA
jgi:GH35 family endo-1,4-beta-xylanase